MRQGSWILVASFTVSILAGCDNADLAPSTSGAELKQQASPTVMTGMGPFEGVSGCSLEFSGFYASVAFDVNAAGVAVGFTDCVAGETLTFRWSELEGMEQLANFPGGYPIIYAESINETGTIAGVMFEWSNTPDTRINRPVLWTASNSRIDLVPVTTCAPGEPWCGDAEPGHYINDNDVVVGTYIDGAYRWTAATGIVYLPILGGRMPTAINSHGDILAGAVLLRKSGQLLEISGIGPTSMNNKREIVGYLGTWPNLTAAIWTRGKGVQALGTLGGTLSLAHDINDRGEVVGASTNAAGEMRAFYWTKSRGMVDLGPGIAYAISDAGHMVGIGPSGLFPGDLGGGELWQAVLWRGTAGVQPTTAAVRRGGMQSARTNDCFDDERNWQSKFRMFRCMTDR